ncbi:MAG: hypothetical protein KW793_02860 [Candidatus Doudnabacteria bacterium]|nr:hypothetical protein [Candidatus Doudnabacteria bacterium]
MIQPKHFNFKYLPDRSFVTVIKNSVGSKMFRSFLVEKNGKQFDVLKKGSLSCAYYASTILKMFGLIDKMHFTVGKTVNDLIKCGAVKVNVKSLKPGDVLIWVSKNVSSGQHNHIGFFIGNGNAVSNSESKKEITRHHVTFKGTRDIEVAFRPNWKRINAKS